MDDCLVFSKTICDHISNLEKVLGALSDAGLILSTEKCMIVSKNVNFLGYEVSEEGIRPNRKYTERIP